MTAIVAIVGRPNVGKSTLFNRLLGKRKAIESSVPGTTRDRIYETMNIGEYEVLMVDTGGLELGKSEGSIEANVQDQSKVAIDGADVILFVVDVRADPTAEDFHAAELLRKSKKKVILVANKCDNPHYEELRYNLYELGFGEPVAVAALHSMGIFELEDAIEESLKEQGFEKGERQAQSNGRLRIAFLGRPNVGKSTMVNALFGKQRVVVSEVAGTTRDSTEVDFEYDGYPFTLVDTAGMRRRGKVEPGIEKYSILRTMQAVDNADVCVVMVDFSEGVMNQDAHVCEYILERKKGLFLVANKVDIIDADEREQAEHMFIHALKEKMAFLPWAPVVFASALERRNVFNILEIAMQIQEQRNRVIPKQELAVWLQMALDRHPPKGMRGKHKFAVLGVKQDGVQPPTFIFSCNWPEIMHFSYGRYLENELRAHFGFIGTPLRLLYRKPGDRGSRRDEAAQEETAAKEALLAEMDIVEDDDEFEEQ